MIGVAGLGWLWAAGSLLATPERLVLRGGGGAVELPPLARVTTRDDSDGAWGLWGNMSGSLEVAGGEFEMFLSGQGWRWHTLMSVDDTRTRMRLVGLQRGPMKLLLMIWDAGPGRTGFAMGEDSGENPGRSRGKGYETGDGKAKHDKMRTGAGL